MQYQKKYGHAVKQTSTEIKEYVDEEGENDDFTGFDSDNDLFNITDEEEKEELTYVAKETKRGTSFLFSGPLELKEKSGDYYVEGFVSSSNVDLGLDIVESTGMKDIITDLQTKNIKLGYIHQEIKGEPRVIPIGRVVEAKEVNGKAYATFLLNSKSSFWTEVHSGIEGKFYDAFSIEYIPTEVDYKNVGNKKVRQLKHLKLVGVALTGRPMNEDAVITGFYAKDLNYKNMEDKTMSETEQKQITVSEAEYKAYQASLQEKELNTKKTQAELEFKERFDAELKKSAEKLAPMFSGKAFEGSIAPELKELQEASNLRPRNEPLTYDQRVWEQKENNNIQKKAVSSYMNTYGKDVMNRFYSSFIPGETKNWEVNGRRIEVKANLLTSTNTTTYTQSAAELNDVYAPVIYNQLNDVATTFGLLNKEDWSNFQKIQFRAVTARNSSAGGYLEDATSWTPQVVTREKYEQAFANYRVIVQMSGQMMAAAQGQGGVGDIWTKEIEDSARHLTRQINVDLITGVTGTYNGSSADALLGLQHLSLGTGTLYGLARGSFTLLQGNQEAMSSAQLSLTQLRKMIRTVVVNGARPEDLWFVMPPLQADKYKAILQAGQIYPTVSARAGFEGMLQIDGVPIFVDVAADTDDVFLVDNGSTALAIKLAPTLEPLYLENYDGRKAFIKVYFNLYSRNPNRLYHSSGFATS